MRFISPLTPEEFRRVVVPGVISVPVVKKRPPIDDIVQSAARHARILPSEIFGTKRHLNVVDARHAAIRVARALRPELSLNQLGRAFRRDHSTIIHAIRRANGLIEAGEPQFTELFESILQDFPREFPRWQQ